MNGLYISQFLSLENGKWVIKKQNCVSKEVNGVHYLLDNSACKAIIIGDQNELTIDVEETVDIDGESYPVDTIWLTYTHYDSYSKTSGKIHLTIPKSIKVVEHITKETFGERCEEKMRVWFYVDEQNPYFSSNNNDYCLYNKDKTVLLHYGGVVDKYEAPDSLISIDTNAFIGIDKNPKVIIFPRGFVKLENKTLCRYCSELHFQGQINHIDAGALDSFNGTIKMNGLLSLIDDEGRNEIKRWYYNERNRDNKRELVLNAPGPMGGKYEDGVITLTKVLRLEEKLACGCDTLPVHFNVNKFFIDGNNISVPMIVDTVVIGGEHTYRPGIYSPLYTEIEVTRIQFVCKTENHDNVLFEILVHESEDEVIELIKKSNKCID